MGLDLHSLLAVGGHAREFMRNAPGGGQWVDSFCDEIVTAISTTPLEDFTLKYGANQASVYKTSTGGVQLNIKWHRDAGWACYTDRTYAGAVTQLWANENLINNLGKD